MVEYVLFLHFLPKCKQNIALMLSVGLVLRSSLRPAGVQRTLSGITSSWFTASRTQFEMLVNADF